MATLAVRRRSRPARLPRVRLLARHSCVLFPFAPALADALDASDRPRGVARPLRAPLLLFVFRSSARIEPAFARRWLPFGVAARAGRAGSRGVATCGSGRRCTTSRRSSPIAAQASWSATHLDVRTARPAVAIYAVFGLVSLAVPVLARRSGTPSSRAWGSGAVLIASLRAAAVPRRRVRVRPAALWALALLLAILNAGLFIESALRRLPLVSLSVAAVVDRAGGVVGPPPAAVGVLPSLTVLAGLTLVTLGGHAWAQRTARRAIDIRPGPHAGSARRPLPRPRRSPLPVVRRRSIREWSIPPWPLFGTLTVLTLAPTRRSLATGIACCIAAGGDRRGRRGRSAWVCQRRRAVGARRAARGGE